MEAQTLLYFGIALTALSIIPGPLVAVIATRALCGDEAGAAAFSVGVAVADLLIILAIVLGIGVWAQNSLEWLSVLKFATCAYLLWLALKLWRDSHLGQDAGTGGAAPRRRLVTAAGAGCVLCLSNPPTFILYLLLLPAFLPEGATSLPDLAALAVVSLAAVLFARAGIILLASRMGRMLVSRAGQAMAARSMALGLGATSAAILMI